MSIAVNNVTIGGNLTRDVDFRCTSSGKNVCSFSVAINEGTKDKPQVTYVDVIAWEKTAELCKQYICKGSPVLIEGSLHFDSWQDKQTGEKRSKLSVLARRVHFLNNKSQEQQNAAEQSLPPVPPVPEKYDPESINATSNDAPPDVIPF